MRRGLPILMGVLGAGAAIADDGVLEINQSCAVHVGCFVGDSAGFPVTISTAGSYRLTGSLTLPDANTDGIQITASSVTVDLGGFEIVGPTVCTAGTTTCTPASGTGTGIESIGVSGIWIKNGGVRGMGSRGVDVDAYSIVEGMRLTSNRAQQVVVGIGSIVRDNLAVAGGNAGVFADTSALVSGNVTTQQGSNGISAGTCSSVVGNHANDNGGDGITVSSGSTVAENRALSNTGDGVQTISSSLVQRNVMASNSGFGLRNVVSIPSASTAYRNNTIPTNLNGLGKVLNGVDLGGNYCGDTNGVLSPCEP